MSLIDFAHEELKRAGMFDSDSDYDGAIGEDVMELMEVFANQGHSGMSASIVCKIFSALAAYLPLSPLTGDDDEWVEVAEQNGGPLYQNRRCSTVFKDPLSVYDIDGKVFREPDGSTYTCYESRVPVTFPYTPKTEVVDVPARPYP